jgi:hypothetical protein
MVANNRTGAFSGLDDASRRGEIGKGNKSFAGFSSPFGKGGMYDDPQGWVTGKVAENDLKDMFSPVENGFQANQYNPNAGAYQIGNQYGGALGSALASANGRATPMAGAASAAGPALGAANNTAANQSALGQALMARVNGTGGPSLAEMQMNRGLDSQIAAQRAQAASARGVSPGMAQRLMANNIAGAQQATNADAAMLRASEQQQAESALGNLLAGQRGQDLGTAQMGMQAGQFNAGMQQQSNLANQNAELQNRAQMDAATQNYIAMGMSREEAQQRALAEQEALKAGQQTSANALNQATAEGNAERTQKAKGGIMSGIGSALGSILSDRTAKTEIRSADKDTEELLDGVTSYIYKYRDQKHGKGDHLGVMAQDMTKSRAGREIVSKREDGLLELDGKKTLGALLAASANLNKRMRKIEAA